MSALGGLLDDWEARQGGRLCQCCYGRRDVMPHRDADGRRFYLCPDCLPRAQADKAAALEARQRAKEARAREHRGQMRLPGTGEPERPPLPPLTLFEEGT